MIALIALESPLVAVVACAVGAALGMALVHLTRPRDAVATLDDVQRIANETARAWFVAGAMEVQTRGREVDRRLGVLESLRELDAAERAELPVARRYPWDESE